MLMMLVMRSVMRSMVRSMVRSVMRSMVRSMVRSMMRSVMRAWHWHIPSYCITNNQRLLVEEINYPQDNEDHSYNDEIVEVILLGHSKLYKQYNRWTGHLEDRNWTIYNKENNFHMDNGLYFRIFFS